MTSGEDTMLRMKAPVGWAGQSAMGQVQFSTKFCSIRVVRYSFQQDCQHERRGWSGAGALADVRTRTLHSLEEGQRWLAPRPTSQPTLPSRLLGFLG